jgi:hypothetical protein
MLSVPAPLVASVVLLLFLTNVINEDSDYDKKNIPKVICDTDIPEWLFVCLFVCLMGFNATFNNISVISWRSVLLVVETRGPGENHRPVASHWQTLSHYVVHLALIEIRLHR